MGEKLLKFKAHVKNNSRVYITAGVGVAAVIITIVVMKQKGPNNLECMNYNAPSFNWRPETNQTVINLVERSTPSKPVHLIGTNLFFDSLHDAARKTGHSVARISKNVNGHIPDVNGDIFELLQKVD